MGVTVETCGNYERQKGREKVARDIFVSHTLFNVLQRIITAQMLNSRCYISNKFLNAATFC